MSSAIEVHTGRFVDPLNIRPEDIEIADIAHALAMQCRFSGHTKRHYSVAEHSVLVAQAVELKWFQQEALGENWLVNPEVGERTCYGMTKKTLLRQALLHDATEAYCVDLPLPLKRAPELAAFKVVEERIWAAVAAKYDVPVELHPWIKEADRRMCSTEKLALLSDYVSEWEWGEFMRLYPPYTPAEFQPDLDYEITPRQARKRFYDFWDRVAP